MRAFIAAFVVALTLVGGAVAVPPQVNNVDPEFAYLVTRILPNGNEITLEVYEVADGYTDEQVVREVALDYGRLQRTNNPAWHVVAYGPTEGAYWTEDDRVWDSTTDQ